MKKMRMIWQALRRKIETIAAAEGLTALQMYVLFGIETGEIMNIGGLSREFNIGHPNASIMCKRLEGAGFISRDRSSDDERFVVLTLTEKGKSTVKRLRTLISKSQNDLINGRSDDLVKAVEGLKALERIMGDKF
ncbi:MAG: MarR family transcriptional regulator, partial [Bacillota bacterium]|nr:MarR family transcriptional regulator [Bacillota bacterium]